MQMSALEGSRDIGESVPPFIKRDEKKSFKNWRKRNETNLDELISQKSVFPMISIIFENRISFSKIGIKKLRKKNILSSCDINANIISRNFTEYSIYSPVRISHAKDARINNFSTLLFYLKIIFYFTILKILCYSRTIKQIWMQICTTLDASFDHTHTHTDEIRWHP